jgi:hypothetical protein
MIPHVIALEPGLIVYKIYNGYWFSGRPTMRTPRRRQKMPPRLGHHHAGNEEGMPRKPRRPLLSPRQELSPKPRRVGLSGVR